jgi:hypothetical protein
MVAIIKRKGELASEAEHYAMTELHEATESLSCKFLQFPPLLLFIILNAIEKSFDDVSTISFDSHSSKITRRKQPCA